MNNVEYLRSLENKRKITLNDWCEAYYNAKVLVLPSNQYDLFYKVAQKAIDILPEFPYRGRVNEFGNHMEKVLIEAIKRVLDVPAKGLGTGYPDVYFTHNGENYYPECKVGKNIFDKPNGFRMFYTSAPSEITKKSKNIKDGYHLLFHFEHDMKKNGIGSLSGKFAITDLEGFPYYIQSIQQGTGKDLYESHNKIIIKND